MWHAAALGPVMIQLGLPSIEVANNARAAALANLLDTMLVGDTDTCSSSDEQLAPLTKPVATCATLSPQSMNDTGLQWQLAMACHGDWKMMENYLVVVVGDAWRFGHGHTDT